MAMQIPQVFFTTHHWTTSDCCLFCANTAVKLLVRFEANDRNTKRSLVQPPVTFFLSKIVQRGNKVVQKFIRTTIPCILRFWYAWFLLSFSYVRRKFRKLTTAQFWPNINFQSFKTHTLSVVITYYHCYVWKFLLTC